MRSINRSRQALDICEELLGLDPEARAARIAARCGDDDALRAAVESLWGAIEDSGSFMIPDRHRADGD